MFCDPGSGFAKLTTFEKTNQLGVLPYPDYAVILQNLQFILHPIAHLLGISF